MHDFNDEMEPSAACSRSERGRFTAPHTPITKLGTLAEATIMTVTAPVGGVIANVTLGGADIGGREVLTYHYFIKENLSLAPNQGEIRVACDNNKQLTGR